MGSVAVTGTTGSLAARVARLAADDPGVTTVLQLDSGVPELKAELHDVDTVVHVDLEHGAFAPDEARGQAQVEATRRVLDACGDAGVHHVVLLSSATVYGAWPDNPVPLTEDAPVRPVPELAYAAQRAEVERLAREWRGAHPGATVAVLRPTVTVDDERASWMARALRAAIAMRSGEEPPAQFLHLDDLAGAVDLARRETLDGVYNVAPDGWIPGDQVRALAGPLPRPRLPERAAARVAAWGWKLRLGPIPPGLLAHTLHPWVVANDRLRAAGWRPAHSNEEAFVAGHPPSPWADLSPKRRQELALAGAGVVVAGVAAAAVALVRRRRNR